MLNKKKDKLLGKCPFRNLKTCSRECILFREGIRYAEKEGNSFPFSDCSLNIIADNLEASHNRMYMMQKEVGETKNVMALKILSDIGQIKKEDVVNKAINIVNTKLKEIE